MVYRIEWLWKKYDRQRGRQNAARPGHPHLCAGWGQRSHGAEQEPWVSPDDRTENIRRIGEVAKLFCDAGIIVLTAFISPYKQDRDQVRAILEDGQFQEVYANASLATCEERDPKGLYKKARAGEIKGFTGIDAPYEAPESAEIELDSDNKGIEELATEVIAYLESNGYLTS